MHIKICGITNRDDLNLVAEAGADCFGVIVDIPYSPRNIRLEDAPPLFQNTPLPGVAVTLDLPEDRLLEVAEKLRPYAIQLAGEEPPEMLARLQARTGSRLWKTLHLPPAGEEGVAEAAIRNRIQSYIQAGSDAVLVDTAVMRGGQRIAGGTGQVSDWGLAARLLSGLPVKTFLSGGLNPDNVADAIRQAQPYGVDVSGGVEAAKGIKDADKVRCFIRVAKEIG